MNKDKCINWIDDNQQELYETFIKEKDLKDEFDEFCVTEYNESIQDYADNLYDELKDSQIFQD